MTVLRKWGPWAALLLVAAVVLAVGLHQPGRPSLDARAQSIEAQVRCPVCHGETVAQSQAAPSVEIRNQIHQELQAGQNESQILSGLVRSYGPGILEKPQTSGISVVVWVVPVIGVVLGASGLVLMLRRWRQRAGPAPADTAGVEDVVVPAASSTTAGAAATAAGTGTVAALDTRSGTVAAPAAGTVGVATAVAAGSGSGGVSAGSAAGAGSGGVSTGSAAGAGSGGVATAGVGSVEDAGGAGTVIRERTDPEPGPAAGPQGPDAPSVPSPSPSPGPGRAGARGLRWGRGTRWALAGIGVALVAAGASWAVVASSGTRLPGQTITGQVLPSEAVAKDMQAATADAQKGDVVGALKEYETILKADPRQVEALSGMGWLLAETGQPSLLKQGLAQLATAEKTDPTYAPAHLYRGLALLGEGDYSGSVPELQWYLAHNPDPQLVAKVKQALTQAQAKAAAAPQAPAGG